MIDVAGLEPVVETDPVRRSIAGQMQERAQRMVEEADFVIHVIDAADLDAPLHLSRDAELIVRNKQDLMSGSPPLAAGVRGGVVASDGAIRRSPTPTPRSASRGVEICLSAKTGANLAELRPG